AGRRARSGMLDAMEVPSHSRQLLLQLNTQRTKGFLCDVIIVVQNALFRAHKNILAASSAYLKSLVVHDNLLNLDHEMVSPGIFRLILDFIYTGRLAECEPGSEQSLGAVLAAASYLQIPGLVALCKKKLKRSGKYCHLRGGYAPYKLGRGMRAATPVIQTCYSGTPRPVDLPPVEPAAPLNTQCGELYASAAQGTPLHPHGLLGDNLYVCIPCGKGFPSSEQLNAHVEAHNEEELYHKAAAEQAVPFLDKGGPGLGDILRPYRCSSCDKSYKDPATLRQHEKTHWLTRPYPCTICGKKFTQRGTMTRHMRSHLGLKPFACDACGMRFTRQYRLTEHMRIHSGEKPYECQVCGGKFAQQRNLISHMKMHAAGPDGKAKLDFPDSVYAMARLTADQLGLKQEKAAELLSHTSHFLSDPKAMESLYPLAKFTAEHLGLSQDKAAEVLAQAPHLHAEAARTIERYSPP
ncbi:HIC1 protein, partial [Todus mexicanus]|nr:HIC1 protein [Todus mexicanus]